jgi:hypothetical protein
MWSWPIKAVGLVFVSCFYLYELQIHCKIGMVYISGTFYSCVKTKTLEYFQKRGYEAMLSYYDKVAPLPVIISD